METSRNPTTERRCRECGATSGLRLTVDSVLTGTREWVCDPQCPTPMTAREPLDLDAVQALADAATDGPWEAGDDGLVWAPRPGDPVSGSTEVEDARFIAAARTALPALVTEVRALRAGQCSVLCREVEEDRDRLGTILAATQAELHAAVAEIERLRTHLAHLVDGATSQGWSDVAAKLDRWAERGYAGTLTEALDAPALPERTAVPGEPLPPLPDSAYAPSAVSLVLGVPAGECTCEAYDCAGECCGVGRCTCTPAPGDPHPRGDGPAPTGGEQR